MSLFSIEERKEFEAVGVNVSAIEFMLGVEYHPIFKEFIQAVLSDETNKSEIVDVDNDNNSSTEEEMFKKDLMILKMTVLNFKYLGLAVGLDKQYHYVKSDGFLGAYISIDSHKGEWVPLLDNFSAMHEEMKGEDKEVYSSLPEKVTIYRGASAEEIECDDFGLSWSLSQEVAKKFATEIAPVKDKVVYKAIVDKSSISAYTNARGEEECIINIALSLDDVFDDVEII